MSKILNLITKKEIQRDEEIRNFSIKIKFMDTGKLKRQLKKIRRYLIIAESYSEINGLIVLLTGFVLKDYLLDTNGVLFDPVTAILAYFAGQITKKLNKTEEFYKKKVDLINEELTEREKKKLRL